MVHATVLVASPSAIGSTPVASGSSVPPCPAFSASSARRTAATARLEVMPGGLSRTSQPWSGTPRRLRAIAVGLLRRIRLRLRQVALDFGPVQQLVDADGMVEGGVEGEGEPRGEAQRHLARELCAQIAGAARQPLDDFGGMTPAQRHAIGRGVLELRADPALGHRHRNLLQRRITQLAALKNVRQGMAQLLAHPQLSLARLAVSLVFAHEIYLAPSPRPSPRRGAGERPACGRSHQPESEALCQLASSIAA